MDARYAGVPDELWQAVKGKLPRARHKPKGGRGWMTARSSAGSCTGCGRVPMAGTPGEAHHDSVVRGRSEAPGQRAFKQER